MTTAAGACDCCGGTEWAPLFGERGFTLGRCGRCDLHYLDRMPAVETRLTEMEAGHFAGEEEVVAAERHLVGEQARSGKFSRYVELARRFAPTGRWLDVGCGAGVLLEQAQHAGYEVEGIELTPDRRATASARTGATVHAAPVEDLGLPAGSFDVISMIDVFSHLVSPTATLTELRRLLRPGGVIVMATGELLDGAEHRHMFNWCLGDHLHWLGERTMDAYAAKVGLTVGHHERVWILDLLYTKEWAGMRGQSGAKNAVKRALALTPGALPAVRAVVRRRQQGNAVHSSLFALTKAQDG